MFCMMVLVPVGVAPELRFVKIRLESITPSGGLSNMRFGACRAPPKAAKSDPASGVQPGETANNQCVRCDRLDWKRDQTTFQIAFSPRRSNRVTTSI